jgi:hypothetical protein
MCFQRYHYQKTHNKAYLVKQSGISSARLFVCQPERDKEDAAKARVDLVI